MLAALEPLVRSTSGYVLAVALGLLWGSFANVCIYRWPAGQSVVAPGSRCPACQAPIRWYDNVPVLAWLWLRGRCRACKAPFSPRYLVVEATTGALFGVAWWMAVIAPAMLQQFTFELRLLHFAIYAAFCFAMVVISFIDLDHKLILNRITMPSIALGYAASLAWPAHRWYDGLVGAAVGYGLPWAIGEIYYRITRREGLGLGDSMLLAVIGALLGWRGVLISLFGGSIFGSIIGITAVILGRHRGEPLPDEPTPTPAAERPSDATGEPGEGAHPSAEIGAEAGAPPGAPPEGQEHRPSLLRTELPFGPFLAMAAVLYLFAEPWIYLDFHRPGW